MEQCKALLIEKEKLAEQCKNLQQEVSQCLFLRLWWFMNYLISCHWLISVNRELLKVDLHWMILLLIVHVNSTYIRYSSSQMPWYGRRLRESDHPLEMLSHIHTLHIHCKGSSDHWLLVVWVFFTKLTGREANVWRFNLVSGHGSST